jgi:hypothetical protein
MKTMKTTLTGMMLCVAAVAACAATGDARFCGGSYDGWDRYAMAKSAGLGGALVSLASDTDQTFAWTEANPALAMLTITAAEPQGTITNGGTMRLTVPAAWACRFDTSASVSIGGGASVKIGAASYADGGRTLEIAVTGNFIDGDILTISGLKLLDLALCAAGIQRLELDFTGNGSRDVYDQRELTLTVPCPGGSYDGWDRCTVAESTSLEPVPGGTTILVR